MEEGPMVGWLYRNLNQEVDKLITISYIDVEYARHTRKGAVS